MTHRPFSLSFLGALAAAFVASPLVSPAQTPGPAPADASSTNIAPAAPTPAPSTPGTPTAPVATPAPADTTAAAPTTERPSSYTIVQGDSLWTIAHKYGTTVVKLRKANKLKKHALLHPGQVLQIPPATTDAATK
jgi:nucleoid-associated protein YgaU